MTTYRVTHDWRIAIVRDGDDQVVAVVVNGDQALAETIVRLLNREQCKRLGLHECGGLWRDHAQDRLAFARDVLQNEVQHKPERQGSDSEGYGACTGCGELWPCAASRPEVS